MVFYFEIITTLFFGPLFPFICVTNLMSSFQKSIMNMLFLKNSSIFLNMIPTKIYCKIDN
jgi:hypothetical protein